MPMRPNSNRWGYMRAPGYNPPNDDCAECDAPSKTYCIGGKQVEGRTVHRWKCERGHTWTTSEPDADPGKPLG